MAHTLLLSLGSEGRVSGRRCQGGARRGQAAQIGCRRAESTPPPGQCSGLAAPALEAMAERQAREVATQQRVRKALKLHTALEGLGTLTPEQRRDDLVAVETDMPCATQRLVSLQALSVEV